MAHKPCGGTFSLACDCVLSAVTVGIGNLVVIFSTEANMIDDKILEREPPIPLIAIVLNQLTSSQTIRAMLVVFSSLTMILLVYMGRDIPDTMTAILFSVVGYYFGEAAPRPQNRP